MNRNNLWKFLLVVLVVLWSVYEMYPPTGINLIHYFQTQAYQRDATFTNIVQKAEQLEQSRTNQTYANLKEAIGTNDITRYFKFPQAQKQQDPNTYVLNELQRGAAGRIHLGLDLQGGTSFVMQMDTNKLENTSANSALSQAVGVLRKRIDRFGVAEPVIQPEGNDRIVVQLPGLSAAAMEDARTTLQKPAFLEFKLVDNDPEDMRLMQESHIAPPGYTIMRTSAKPGDKNGPEEYLVQKRPLMTGGIKSAMVTRGNLGEPEIAFTLESSKAAQFGRITTEYKGRLMAIVLDGQLQTAPVIKSPILDGNGVIQGTYSEEEAFNLVNVLENPLQAPLKIISSSEVDPTLGQDSIRSGIRASIIGVILVAVFMLVYYLLAGLVANVALMLNIVILVGAMCAFGTTFTLPGIAGVVLTIGMAVDANVLIYERIREEAAAGKSMRGALSAGYDKAFGTIFDSNLTTLISSVILIFMGTGPVKGFGWTLTIGLVVSLFTALVVTRLVFDWLLAKNLLKSLPMLHIIRGSKLDFMRLAIPAFIASWLLILIGNGYGLIGRGQDILGVEFTGGDNITLAFNPAEKVGVDKLREAAAKAGARDVLLAYQRNIGAGTENLKVTVRSLSDKSGEPGAESLSARVIKEFQTEFPQAQFEMRGVDHVGPTIGREIRRTAVTASIIAMFGILVYVAFRYEFSFAVGAVLAIVHDVLMTLGWYFLTGREMNATTVAAVLTIIGFSINDTIVIFDRIREDLKLGVRGTFREVMNKALNQTLSRTIITSGTVFLATLSLYIFGGGVINDFAFAFLVGILTGTYSSIYIASALVLWWHKGKRPHIGSGPMAMEAAPAARPAQG